MERFATPRRRLETALALSIALHCCGLAVLAPFLTQRRFAADVGAEPTVRYVSLITVVRTRTPAPRPPVARPRPVRATRPLVALATPRPMPVAARRGAPARRAASPRRHAAPSERIHVTLAATVSARIVAAAPIPPPPTTPLPAVRETAAPEAVAVPAAPSPAPTASAQTSFGGLFSENYPPALADPAALAGIRSRLRGHGRIRITVDETGRASAISFVGGEPESDAESDVRTVLLGLRYVPAECSGLHCEGSFEIAY